MARRKQLMPRVPVQLPATNGHKPNGKLLASANTQGIIEVTNNDRMLFQLWGELKPDQLAGILRQAQLGNLIWQERLFQKMIDEWPRLQKNLLSLKRDVANIGWGVQPYSDKGSDPSPLAQDKAALVERALFGMVGDPTLDQSDFSGLIKDLVDAVPMCFSVNEIYWTMREGEIVPQCTKKVPARFYGYAMEQDKPDRLMLNPQGDLALNWERLTDFPANKFLIGVYKANANHPSAAAMLRSLTPWWFASKYGLKWFMGFCQMFGTPMRMAEYTPGDTETFNSLCTMLEQMGFANWGVFPTGAKVELLESKSTGGTMLPQRVLLCDADEQCDIMILGQTLTSNVSGSGGNRALGQVHADTEIKVLNGVSDFIESVINTQLIPAIIMMNYGETSELPFVEGSMEVPADELVLAQRDFILFQQMDLPVAKDFLYARHSVPEPAEDAELYEPVAAPAPMAAPVTGLPKPPSNSDQNEPPTPPHADPLKAVAAQMQMPSMQMAVAVKKGLDLRAKLKIGGTLSAVTRARDISSRKGLSLSTVKRMALYFDSHSEDADADPNSAAGIAWALHGGNAGRAWVEHVCKASQVEAFNPNHGKDGEFSSGGGGGDKASSKELLENASKRFKLKGIDNKETTCTHCGKEELKRVMWIEHRETGEISAVGTSCGAKLLGLKNAGQVDKWAKTELAPEIKEQTKAFKAELEGSKEHQAWFKEHQALGQWRESNRYNPATHGDSTVFYEKKAVEEDKRLATIKPLVGPQEAKEAELHKKYPLAKLGLGS